MASVSKNILLVDCDVDAPNLEILLKPDVIERCDFYGMQKAEIIEESCVSCGICRENCRFDAIIENEKIGTFFIDRTACEGCRLCFELCPSDAVRMTENLAGHWFVSNTGYAPFIHAKLKAAEENSGRLVAVIRNIAKEIAERDAIDFIIIDGPPGIGCPLISTLSGVDLAIVIFEPTFSSFHDGKRVIEVAEHFGIGISCIINKFDLNEMITQDIEGFCRRKGIQVLENIPYDEKFVKALSKKEIIAEVDKKYKDIFEKIWSRILGNFKYL